MLRRPPVSLPTRAVLRSRLRHTINFPYLLFLISSPTLVLRLKRSIRSRILPKTFFTAAAVLIRLLRGFLSVVLPRSIMPALICHVAYSVLKHIATLALYLNEANAQRPRRAIR